MSQASEALVFSGNIKLQPYVSGTPDVTMLGPLDAQSFKFNLSSDRKQRKTKQRGKSGKLKGQIVRNNPTTLTIDIDGATPEVMAAIFQGSVADLSVSGGTAVGESITFVHDQWVKVAQRNISAVVITGKTEGTDYLVDKNIGAVMALSEGTIAEGAGTLNYTYSGITGSRITAGTKSKVDYAIHLDGLNEETLSDAYVYVPKVTLSPNGDIDLLADDFGTVSLTGEIEFLDSESGEFYVDGQVVYA